MNLILYLQLLKVVANNLCFIDIHVYIYTCMCIYMFRVSLVPVYHSVYIISIGQSRQMAVTF